MKIDWNVLPEMGLALPGVTRKAICAPKMSAVLVEVAAGTDFQSKTHWHDNEQMLVMISGTCRFEIDGETIEAHPGELVFFPSGSRHSAVGVGSEGCAYIEFFAPARPDQLPGWVGESVLRFD